MTVLLHPDDHPLPTDHAYTPAVMIGTSPTGEPTATLRLSTAKQIKDPTMARALGRTLFQASYLLEGEAETDLWCAECGTHSLPMLVSEDTEICLPCHQHLTHRTPRSTTPTQHQRQALQAVLDLLTDPMTADAVAPMLNWSEADTIIDLLRSHGRTDDELIQTWLKGDAAERRAVTSHGHPEVPHPPR